MKPSNTPTSPVAVTCQVVRLWSALRNENASPHSHFNTCECCRQFIVSTRQLHSDLRLDALRSSSMPSAGMERRVIAAIRVLPASPREPKHRSFLTFAVAGSAAALVFAGLGYFDLSPFSGHRTGAASDYSAEVAALVAAVRTLPANFNENLTVPTIQLAQDNALNREVENVYADARSALNFLTLNFLPASNPSASVDQPKAEPAQRT